MLGTEDEWSRIQANADMEGKRNLFRHFEVVTLNEITADAKKQLILEILQSRSFQDLGYRVDVSDIVRERKNIPQDEACHILAQHLANRIESVSDEGRIAPFTGFMRVLSLLSQELSTNRQLRQSGLLNRAVLEQIVAKVYPIPLNLDLLAPDDPLRIIAEPEFPLRWQQAGYDGPVGLKKSVIDTILSQLSNDGSKNVPSSILIHGETGTGKTSLVLTLFEALGLQMYEFNEKADNGEAQAFFLSMNKIYEKGGNKESGSEISLKEADKYFDNFLLQSNGSRGFMCLDDLHLAPPEVKEHFIKKARTILESDYYNIEGEDIPTGNITIIMTMNPTEDQKQIEKYTSDKKKGPTDQEVILATLNDGRQGKSIVEKSFLARIGLLLNLDRFPSSAKGPALIRAIARMGKRNFQNSGKWVLVTPEVVSDLVQQFPKTDARNFLSSGARSLLQLDASAINHLFVAVPRNKNEARANPFQLAGGGYQVSGGSESSEIVRFVEANVDRLSLEVSPLARMYLLNFLVNNFRRKAFEVLFRSVSEDPRYFSNTHFQRHIVGSLARAIHDHLATLPQYPLDLLQMNFAQFGSPNEKAQYVQAFADLKARTPSVAPLPLVGITPPSQVIAELLRERGEAFEVTRQHVLRDQIISVGDPFRTLLHAWVYVEDLLSPPSSKSWLNALPDVEPKFLELVGEAFTDDVVNYLEAIYQGAVTRSAFSSSPMSQYDALRFYAMAVDRALGLLAWPQLTVHLTNALITTSENLMYGQKRGVQYLLFDGKSSPLIAIDPSFILELTKNSLHYGDDDGVLGKLDRHQNFMGSCRDLLSVKEGGN